MESTRTIRCGEVVQDIRSGLTDVEIMGKYGLSTRLLHAVLARLIRAKAIGESEIRRRAGCVTDPTNGIRMREIPRHYAFFPVPVFIAGNRTVKGHLNDISMRGLGLAGISSRVGQVLKLLVRADDFADIDPFAFDARCQWGKRMRVGGQKQAGFEITELSGKAMEELGKLIQVLTLGEVEQRAYKV
jgi:hypothetical protein